MKKIFCLLFIVFIFTPTVYALNHNYKNKYLNYYDRGSLYSNSVFMNSVANNRENITADDLSRLKRAEVTSCNLLGLAEWGNAGLNAAIKKAGIKKVHYVDIRVGKAYVPLWIIPIYLKQTTTIVYGE